MSDRYEKKYGHIEGPSDEELTQAYRGHQFIGSAAAQKHNTHFGGNNMRRSPRGSKHRGMKVGGVRIK